MTKNFNELLVLLADFVGANVSDDKLEFQTQLRLVLENPANASLLLPALENNTLKLTTTGEYLPTTKGLRLSGPVKPVAKLLPRRIGKHTPNEVLFETAYPVMREFAYRNGYEDFRETLQATEMYSYITSLITPQTDAEAIESFVEVSGRVCEIKDTELLKKEAFTLQQCMECITSNYNALVVEEVELTEELEIEAGTFEIN